MEIINPLVEVVIKMKFWAKGDTLARCEKAGIRVHIEDEAEYNAKRESQLKDGQASGLNVERYGRRDGKGNIIYDPGVQIVTSADVKLFTLKTDLESHGFKLVELEVFQGHGAKSDAYFFISKYASDDRKKLTLTSAEKNLHDWFFNRVYGNVYVWRNFGGAQFDIPALSIRGSDARPIDFRLFEGGRTIRIGSREIKVAFKGDPTTVNA